jgi:RimJ/RimL family protein N-acetyltransferase
MTTPPSDSFPRHIHLSEQNLILREWADADLPAMVELFDDPEVDRWTPLRTPFNLDAARAYLDRARQLRTAGQRLQLAITRDGTTPLGEILLFRAEDPHAAELAYAVGAQHRRQHLASRAVQLITDYAYRTLAMNTVLLRIPAANTASAAVARTAGFHLDPGDPTTRNGVRYPLHTWRHQTGPL